MTRPPLYGFDLLTGTAAPATEPVDEAGPILAIGLSLEGCERCFDGDEPDVLAELDEFLAELPAGVLVTWHGAAVDLPLVAVRATVLGVAVGLRLRPDVRDAGPCSVPGPPGSASREARWCGAWHQHRHLDLTRVYAAGPSRSWGRRSTVPEDLIPPADERTGHDPRHDAHLARCLAERRWSRARRLIDRMSPAPGAGPRLAAAPTARHTA